MRLAVYSRQCDGEDALFVKEVLAALCEKGCELLLHRHCAQIEAMPAMQVFDTHQELAGQQVDFLLSFGGDGTYIDAANLVGDLNIPLVGVNTGRVGFLTTINRQNYAECLNLLLDGKYVIENRFLLHLDCSDPLSLDSYFALNDITVRTSDENSINAIKVWVGGKPVNTYWGDGLIIATPTGSTAYSMSCGGPIIVPDANVNVLTPIASHTLAVRPMVISADEEIRIVVESRNNSFSLALDSHRVVVENPVELRITKEKFHIRTVLFEDTDFYRIIREKLLWGIDKRNL
ncbi:MAG: NAD(+)/NADH kinase [Bacteroidales bacterium]|nr:NAD(+)/NADH kinase [Bacteroidales bacterium]